MHRTNIKLSLAGAVILSLAYSLFIAISVRSEANSIAADYPFCIQTAGISRYREAHSLIHFFPLFMYGHGGLHHAVLVVGDLRNHKMFHWSYFKNSFVEGAYGPLPIYCHPSPGYLRHFKSNQVEGINAFSLAGVSLRIPDKYRPEPDWPGSAIGFHFFALPPDFLPIDNAATNWNSHYIEVSFSRQPQLDTWRTKQGAGYSITPMEETFGLRRQFVSHSKYSHYEFYAEDTDGRVKTIIACFESMRMPCRHSFERNGWTYTFHHSLTDTEHWERLQGNLVNLVESFRSFP